MTIKEHLAKVLQDHGRLITSDTHLDLDGDLSRTEWGWACACGERIGGMDDYDEAQSAMESHVCVSVLQEMWERG